MKWLGIDGGGTSLRVVIVDDEMQQLAYAEGQAANPSSIGHDLAKQRIQNLMHDVMQQLTINTVDGVGIGIAGASNEYATDWLLEVTRPVVPDSKIIPASDVEIALVGGRAQLDGILLLAGTGSIALGIHPHGQRMRVGGWGYLLGDEGSGYWLGAQALRALTTFADGQHMAAQQLANAVCEYLGFKQLIDVIPWRYKEANQREVAALAPLVLQLAAEGDRVARQIIDEGATHLAGMATHLMSTLHLSYSDIVFAGGLLTGNTVLQHTVQQKLGLSAPPLPLYPPVVGAALLAKLKGQADAY